MHLRTGQQLRLTGDTCWLGTNDRLTRQELATVSGEIIPSRESRQSPTHKRASFSAEDCC